MSPNVTMASLRSFPYSAHRAFSTNTRRPGSVLFALGALSNSRETQHFNKLSRLQRVEHSPALKLIESSEVDPYSLSAPLTKSTSTLVRDVARSRSPARMWDARALQAGRTLLAENARRTFRLQRSLEKAKRKEDAIMASLSEQAEEWARERRKMRNEVRSAGVWILFSVGVATGLAMFRFWPQSADAADSSVPERTIAEKAQDAILPRISAAVSSPPIGVTGPTTSGVLAKPTFARFDAERSVEKTVPVRDVRNETGANWWRSLFWKQQ